MIKIEEGQQQDLHDGQGFSSGLRILLPHLPLKPCCANLMGNKHMPICNCKIKEKYLQKDKSLQFETSFHFNVLKIFLFKKLQSPWILKNHTFKKITVDAHYSSPGCLRLFLSAPRVNQFLETPSP